MAKSEVPAQYKQFADTALLKMPVAPFIFPSFHALHHEIIRNKAEQEPNRMTA